ncbi:MAG: DUF3303 family protein [Bryobacteraceae bacterium]
MLFVINYKTSPATRNAGQKRFLEGGGLPPANVKMLGRWHYADGSGGVTVAESDDASAVAKWAQDWSDVLVLETRLALADEQMGAVIAG